MGDKFIIIKNGYILSHTDDDCFVNGKEVEKASGDKRANSEILEELKMEITVKEEFLTVVHQYPDFILTMHSFICDCIDRKLTLTEHIDFQWLKKDELINLDWAAADIPIMKKLLKLEL